MEMKGFGLPLNPNFSKSLSEEEIAVAIEKNKQFSSECLEVKPSPIGPEIVLKGRNEDEIINGARELTKAYKQNPKLRSKIYSGLKTDFPSSFYENSFGDFGYKAEEEEEKDEAALELIEAIQASEAVLNAQTENGERLFGYNPVSDKLHYILDSLDRKRFNGVKVEVEEEIKENLGFIKRYKKPLIGATALALGATVVYPSLAKGKLTFDPGLILKDVANMLSRTYINPHTIFNNLNPAIYLMSSITRRETFDVKRKLLYGLLGGLLAYEIGDIFFGFPGLVDLGETVYLVYNMRPSDATYPWQWKWSKSWNLALKTSDLDSLRGIFTGNSELLKLINYYHQISRLPGIEGDHEIVYDFISPLFSDGKISPIEEEMVKKFMIYHPKVYGLIPEDIRKNYYTNKEVYDISRKLIEQLFSEGNPSSEVEGVANNLLSWKRWWVVRDIINSGMINEKNLKEDWDLDGLNNLTEIKQGTNPLNPLERNPNNLSERWALITAAGGYVINDFEVKSIINILTTLKKNGYGDENVFLVIDPGLGQVGMIKNFPIKPDFMVEYVNGQRVPGHQDLEAEHFLNYIKNMPSDDNDTVFIYVTAHGNTYKEMSLISPGRIVYVEEVNEALKQMEYGEAIFLVNCSEAGGFVRNLRRLNPNPNLLLIGTQSESESVDLTTEAAQFVKYLGSGLSVEEAFKNFALDLKKKNYHPVMNSVREEHFINPLIYKKLIG